MSKIDSSYQDALAEVRSRRFELMYWPPHYRDVYYSEEEDEAKEVLPPVNYQDIAYEEWSVTISCMVRGVSPPFMESMMKLRHGPEKVDVGRDEIVYATLLYRTVKLRRHHDDYDDFIFYLYVGFLRGIEEEHGVNALLTYGLIKDLGGLGCYYISFPFYEYDIILLDDKGYFYNYCETSSEEDE